MDEPKEILTTGDVARACHVTINTVIKWFEQGRLPGWRLPGSRDRRFARGDVERFMRDNGMPVEALDPGPRRVLVVDDDEAIREMIDRYLSRLGTLEVLTAASGWEGGIRTARDRPHVLILDYRLGDTTADKVIGLVRGNTDLPQPAILVMSAHLSDDEARDVLDKGADDYLAKPFEFDELRDRVLRLAGLLA